MGTVNYIKGLYGPVRVSYPLAFSPSGIIDPTTGHALSAYAVIGGAGYSTTYPEISDLASARFVEWNLKTTNTGSGEVYGEYMSLQSGGTGTGYVYTKGALAKSVAGGYVAEMGACYYKSQLTAGTVTGQSYVGFFEYIVDSGVANMPSGGVIQLVDVVSGSLNAVHGYISIRTYGTTPFSNLFNIADHTTGTGKLFYGSTLKNRIDTTSYYIPLSTAENSFTFSGTTVLTGNVTFGTDGTGVDVRFNSANAGRFILWDKDGDTDGALFIGSSAEGIQVNMYGDTAGCGVFWDPTTDTNGTLTIGATGGSKGNDVLMYGVTNGNYVQWDQSANELMLVGTSTTLHVAGTTESVSTVTGSIHTAGGLGVVGDCYLGDDVFLSDGAVINFNAGEITITNGTSTLDVASTWAVAGAAEEMFSVTLTTNVSLGSYANAFFAKVDCQTVGGATGLLSAGCFEILSPTTGIAGTTAGVEIEMGYGATCGALQKPCFMYLATYGTAKTDFDTYGDFVTFGDGLTAGTGKMVGAGTSTLRIGTGALGQVHRYIPLSTAEASFTTAYPIVSTATVDALSITCSTLTATNGRIASFKGTQATPNMTDGYGLIENELTVSGTATGQINLTSSWINLGDAAVVPGYITLHTDGIWDGTATLTTAMVSMQKYTCQLASNPAWLSIWELNFQQDANNIINAMFNTNDLARGLGYVAATPTAAAIGSIPFCSVGGGAVQYIRLYADATT